MDLANVSKRIRKRRNGLCLGDKLKIVQQLDNCEKQADLAKAYNVSTETISRIYKTREQILSFAKMHGSIDSIVMNSKKTLSLSRNEPLEQHVYQWFMAKKETGVAVTGVEIREEALRANRNLGGSSEFKASAGWLERFKRRHGIRQVKLSGAGLGYVDSESAKNICDEIEKTIQENSYKPENIYNAVKNGIQWNSVPQNVENIGSLRILKDRVPLVFAVNSDGSHRLPVLVSGRVQNPRSFADEEIPVKYVFHGNGYPSDLLISQWFSEVFIPEINLRRQSQEKILLVTDTAPTSSMTSHAKEYNVQIIVLPMETISVLQPLYQGIFEKFKERYKEFFMNEMVVEENGKKYALNKKWTIRDCCFTIARAWDSFTNEDFQIAWRKLLKIDQLDDRNNQVTFYSCGVTEELGNKFNEEQCEVYQTMGELSSSSSDVQSSVDSGHLHSNIEDSLDREIEFKPVVPSTVFQDPSSGSENNQLETDEKNLRIEMEKLLNRPSTTDALNAVTTLFGWANYQGNVTRQDIWDIVKLRSMILSRTS